MLCLTESIRPNDPSMQRLCHAVDDARALTGLIVVAWKLARVLAVDSVERSISHAHEIRTPRRRTPPDHAVSSSAAVMTACSAVTAWDGH